MKTVKKCAVVIALLLPAFTVAENIFIVKEPIELTAFENEAKEGSLYISENVGPDEVSGNSFVFDPSGDMYVVQYDQRLFYRIRQNTYSIEQIAYIDLPSCWGILKADGQIFEFSDGATGYMRINYNGDILVKLQLNRLFPQFVSNDLGFYYYSNVLFFIDDQFNLHSLLSPSIDQDKNQENYRNPEQTKEIFAPDSGIDLKGLTIDDKGLMYLNGVFIGPKFMPVVGAWRYSLNQGRIIIGNATRRLAEIAMPSFGEDETLESTAIHPSGDIYFLSYNKAKNKHILYKIENTWDKETKKSWEIRTKYREAQRTSIRP